MKTAILREKNPNWRGGKIVFCNTCSREVWRKPYLLKKFKVFFCSINCQAEYKKTLDYSWEAGENNWHWKGGTHGTERHRAMKQKEYILWRVAVFMRDDYTCQGCKQRGGKLEADHIKPWALYPDLRYAINNGRTLCKKCHLQIGWRGSYANIGQNL